MEIKEIQEVKLTEEEEKFLKELQVDLASGGSCGAAVFCHCDM
jgi:hypothetical protein